jgi:ADP-dependent phosphofructokinase/glucokinase
MNLTKTYHHKETSLRNLSFREYECGITFKGGYQGTANEYRFEVDAEDYLKVARKAVKRLKDISGMDYCIMAKHPSDTTWRALL